MFDSIWIALLAGLAAGLVASVGMESLQNLILRLSGSGGSGSSATARAANAAVSRSTGQPLRKESRPTAGRVVHYVTGIALGGVYGVMVHFWPAAAVWNGVAFGLAVWLIVDEALVPLFGFGSAPWQSPLSSHLFGAATHIFYGLALEAVRRLLLTAFA